MCSLNEARTHHLPACGTCSCARLGTGSHCVPRLCQPIMPASAPPSPSPSKPHAPLQLYKVVNSQPSPEQLRAAYDAVCARFPPAMHHFFLENFRDPGGWRSAGRLCFSDHVQLQRTRTRASGRQGARRRRACSAAGPPGPSRMPATAAPPLCAGTWFERRLAYTRSMAVNSMAGHIIGLGDRHLQNVLLDTRTADAVHIDLGIAFEQARRGQARTPLQPPWGGGGVHRGGPSCWPCMSSALGLEPWLPLPAGVQLALAPALPQRHAPSPLVPSGVELRPCCNLPCTSLHPAGPLSEHPGAGALPPDARRGGRHGGGGGGGSHAAVLRGDAAGEGPALHGSGRNNSSQEARGA